MGNSISPGFLLFNDNGENNTDLQNRIKTAFPDYYIQDTVITEIDIATAFLSWQTIMESEDIESYLAARLNPDFEFTSCLSWFFSVFYDKFFELCPESKEMFVNVSILAQGRLLAGVISSSFDVLKNPERLEKRLIKIVNRHNPMNIKAAYYGLMGEALLWTLEFTLGSRYSTECALAWTKIYSFLLNIIIPRAAEYEYKLSLGRKSGNRIVSQKNSDSEKSTIRSSVKSIKTSIEERIRNSANLFRNNNITNGSSNKMGRSSSLSKKCHIKVCETTATRNFESTDYCPFARKSINIETAVTTPASTSAKEEISLRKKRPSRSTALSIDDKPIQIEYDYQQQNQPSRTCPMDTMIIHSDVKSMKAEVQQRKSVYLKSLLSIELSESDDIKVPYFNHTGIQPIGTMAITTTNNNNNNNSSNNISDISYEDFKVNQLYRYNNNNKVIKPQRGVRGMK